MAATTSNLPDIDNLTASIELVPLELPWLECGICFEVYSISGDRIPVQLSSETSHPDEPNYSDCQHTICLSCARTNPISDGARRCPLCRQPVSRYSKNELAIKLIKQGKMLIRQRDFLVDQQQRENQQRTAQLQAQRDETAALLRQSHDRQTQDHQELVRIQAQREQALEELRLQRHQESVTRQKLDQDLHAHAFALRRVTDELDQYRRTNAAIEEQMSFLLTLGQEAQKLQDDLSAMQLSLRRKDSEVHSWQRKYQTLESDLHSREAEIEQLKAALRQHQAAQQADGTGIKGAAATWMNFAASWLYGDAIYGVGALTKSLADYELFERLGASLGSSVQRGRSLLKGEYVAIKRIAVQIHEPEAPSASGLVALLKPGTPPAESPAGGAAATTTGTTASGSHAQQQPGARSRRLLFSVCREAMFLKQLRHEGILDLQGFVYLPQGPEALLVMEYMNFDLEFMVESNQLQTEDRVRNIMFQILAAVDYLHHSSIAHRNLATTSILIDESHRVKLGSFRDARCLLSSTSLDAVHVSSEVGCRFFSPDLIWFLDDSSKYRPSSAAWKWMDMWSLGVIFAEMLIGVFSVDPVRSVRLFEGSTPQKLFNSIFQFEEIRPRLSPAQTETIPLLHNALIASPQAKCISLRRHIAKQPRFTSGPGSVPPSREALDLLFLMLRYDPTTRTDTLNALSHPFFLGREPPLSRSISTSLTDNEVSDFSNIQLGIKL